MYAYAHRIVGHNVSFRDFLVRRLSKLYPLHFILLCAVALLQLARLAADQSSFVYANSDAFHFLLNVLLIQTGLFDLGYSFNGPSWVISLLIYMYILLFLVLTKLRSNRYFVFACLVLLGLISIKSGWPNIHIARVVVGFMTGCLTYGVYCKLAAKTKSRHLSWWIAAVLISGIVLDVKSNYSTFIVYGESLPLLLWPAVILTVLNVPLLYQALSIRPLIYLGKMSYSIFLVHFPIQLIIFTTVEHAGLDIRSSYVFAIYVVSTLLISSLSHKYLELPLQTIFRRGNLR